MNSASAESKKDRPQVHLQDTLTQLEFKVAELEDDEAIPVAKGSNIRVVEDLDEHLGRGAALCQQNFFKKPSKHQMKSTDFASGDMYK